MVLAEQIAVVIPCLNEADSIAALVTEVRQRLPHVLVVDDGSSDGTGARAATAGAQVVRNPQPGGKGSALNRGLARVRARGFQWALVMDGDGQHAPTDIPKFLAAMTRAPLLVGNRMTRPRAMPWLRRAVNRWMSRRLSSLVGRPLPDTQCGFRLIDLDCWSALDLRASHFETESELLLAFIAARHPVEFVPIEVIYKNERSKIHPVRDTLRWLRWFRTARRQFIAASVRSAPSWPTTSRGRHNGPRPSPGQAPRSAPGAAIPGQ